MKIKKKASKSEIAKMILAAVGFAGLTMIPIAGPITLIAIAQELKIGIFAKRKVSQSIGYLRNQELLGISEENGKTVIKLTKNGKRKLLKYQLDSLRIKKPKKWDRKWRAVIFDIPEKYKLGRECLRAKLKELGFCSLQKSVWVFPYPCEDEIDFIKELYEITPFVRILTVESIDIDKDLIKYFNF